jgi:hypothetical protein
MYADTANNVPTQRKTQTQDGMAMRDCRGNMELLARTAHGACLHPMDRNSILIFGGYGTAHPSTGTQTAAAKEGAAMAWLSDLVTINTVSPPPTHTHTHIHSSR